MKQVLKNYGDYLLVKKGLGEVTILGYTKRKKKL
jgi:hypothetical protein